MKNTDVLLIIDSDDDHSIELNEALNDNNFKVIKVFNIRKSKPDEIRNLSSSVLVCQFHQVKTDYLNLLSKLTQEQPRPIILFTNDDDSVAIEKSTKVGVNAYIVDGFNSERIKTIIEIAISRFNSYQTIADELLKTRQQLEDRKIIDKAKGILMKSKNIDEQQAYISIRKMAMDKSKSMADIAQSIIDVMDVM